MKIIYEYDFILKVLLNSIVNILYFNIECLIVEIMVFFFLWDLKFVKFVLIKFFIIVRFDRNFL